MYPPSSDQADADVTMEFSPPTLDSIEVIPSCPEEPQRAGIHAERRFEK